MKKCRMISLFLAIILCLPIPAAAHAGDTDAYGGHYDHDSGEYHYHHGYPAHMHYDMDGDGFRDCPYDFDDKTGVNSGSSNGSSSSNDFTPLSYSDGYADGHTDGYWDGYNDGHDSGYKEGYAKGHDEGYSKGYETHNELLYNWIGFFFFTLIVVSIAFSVTNKKKTAKISELVHDNAVMAKQHEKQLKSISDSKSDLASIQAEITQRKRECDQVKAKLTLEQNALQELRAETANVRQEYDTISTTLATEKNMLEYTKRHRQQLKDAPPYITFSDNGEPVYWKPDPQKPYGDYTVYLNKAGTIYHADRYCASYNASTRHIFAVISTARPCEKCAKQAFDFTSPPDWYTLASSPVSHKVYTIAELEEKALQMGVSIETAKYIINLEHSAKGLPPAEFEEYE